MRTREALAWAAGFFEGEGTVRRSLRQPGISVCNTDLGSLERFRDAVGLGKIYGPYRYRNSTKPLYQYWACDFEGRQALAAMLWHWLSDRRRAQLTFIMQRELP